MCLVCMGCPARGGRALQTYVSNVFDVCGVWLSAGVPAMREHRGEGRRPSPSQAWAAQAWAPQAWAPQAWQAGLHLDYGFKRLGKL